MKKDVLFGLVVVVFIVSSFFVGANLASARTGDSVGSATSEIIGKSAPDFTLPSSTGERVSLSDYKGKKNVLLYFHEGVMCDPCWEQIADIEKEYDKFASKDIELVSVTVDPLNAITKNAKRFGLATHVLADEDLKVSRAYDALRNSMHPGERPGHTFFLIDKNGKVVWKKEYFLASGSTKMTMDMGNGNVMTMDMGMDMGKPGSVMYVPVARLLSDMEGVELRDLDDSSEVKNMASMSAEDHSMCLTPIHNHVDFKMYLNGAQLNFSQNNYMDQSNVVHFHKTVKANPDDVAGLPNGDMIHIHREDVTLREFLKTLDLAFNVDNMTGLKVYVNGNMKTEGLDYVMKDKDRILVTDDSNEANIRTQIDSVTDYALQGKEKNPSLFGGC